MGPQLSKAAVSSDSGRLVGLGPPGTLQSIPDPGPAFLGKYWPFGLLVTTQKTGSKKGLSTLLQTLTCHVS